MRLQPSISFLFLLSGALFFFSGCANLDTLQGRLQHDTNYLLEEKLHDGEDAAWTDDEQPGVERNLAVFLTCTEEGDLCRYYFTFLVEKGKESARVFGKSCRNSHHNWDEVSWDRKQNLAQHKLIRSRYQELKAMNSNAPPYGYSGAYKLPAILDKQARKAEKKYRLPLREMIDTAARNQRVNAVLIHSMVKTESSYNPKARSHVGAMGLMQLMPATARELGVNPRDPEDNLKGGSTYIARQLKRPGIKGNVALALAAYNAGYGNVKKHGYKVPPYKETRNYVSKIMTLYKSQ